MENAGVLGEWVKGMGFALWDKQETKLYLQLLWVVIVKVGSQ